MFLSFIVNKYFLDIVSKPLTFLFLFVILVIVIVGVMVVSEIKSSSKKGK